MRKYFSRKSLLGLLTLLLLTLAVCMPPPPEPGSGHTGWGKPDCSKADCHQGGPNIFHDSKWLPGDCAECHGGNGACHPRDGEEHTHSKKDDCLECHDKEHGNKKSEHCAACHFADFGTKACKKDEE